MSAKPEVSRSWRLLKPNGFELLGSEKQKETFAFLSPYVVRKKRQDYRPRRHSSPWSPNSSHDKRGQTMDQLLIDSGLIGKGLVHIKSPKVLQMYNDALVSMGVEPTSLSEFWIDGIGWSPQIAAEKKDPEYMGFGSGRFAIIASPDQEGKPIFLLRNTNERRLLRSYMARFRQEVANVNISACVELQQRQNILVNESPKDYLLFDSVTVVTHVNGLMEAAAEQKALVEEFKTVPDAWRDRALREKIIESAKVHGDLRRRKVEIPEFLFSLRGNFWSKEFGGVFVLRSGMDSILIVEDESWLPKIQPQKGERYKAFALSQTEKIIDHLLEEDLVELDLKRYRIQQTNKSEPNPLKELDELELFMTMDAVCALEPECEFSKLSLSRRDRILVAAGQKNKVVPMLSDLQHLSRGLRSGEILGKALPRVPDDLRLLLLRPHKELGDSATPIIWLLLLRMQENPMDVLKLYTYDKERFFALFEKWPASKKRWAAKYIPTRYESEMEKR